MRQSFALFPRRLTPRLWVEDWGAYAPAPEAAAPNAPPLTQYTFRRGNLWQIRKQWPVDLVVSPPPTITQSSSGGVKRQMLRWQYEADLLLALHLGVITKDEWTALMIL